MTDYIAKPISLVNGRKYTPGDRVWVATIAGSKGRGTVLGYIYHKVCVEMDDDTKFVPADRWRDKAGVWHNRPRHNGVSWIEIQHLKPEADR